MSLRMAKTGCVPTIHAIAVAGALCLAAFAAAPALSATTQTGSVTGLPLPRFVSLKTDRVNLHEGPTKEHRTVWIYQRAGLPVEITAEFDTWRKIRDSDGAEGWVLHSLLSGRRTAIVQPWQKGVDVLLRAKPTGDSGAVAKLQSGVIGAIKSCNGTWCRLIGDNFDGWAEQQKLWGSYPGEIVE
jgi:SH3-like domain-containing protein